MSHPLLRAASILALSSFAVGCSGGGGTLVVGTPAVGSPRALAAVVAVVIPVRTASALARRALYVSSGTQSFAISASGTSGAATTQVVNVASSACAAQANGSITCTIGYVAPSGATYLTLQAYAAANAAGALLTSGTVALPPPDPSGAPVSVAIAMGGAVASVGLSLGAQLAPGTQATVSVIVTARDASGATIVGGDPYLAPIALAASATAFAFSPATVTSPSTAVTLTYTGAAVTSPTLSATTAGGVSVSVSAFGGATGTPAASPTAAPTAAPTASASATPTPTPNATPTGTPVPTPSPTPTITVTIQGRRP